MEYLGNVGDGIIQFKAVDSNFFLSPWLSSLFALVLFLIVYLGRTWFVQPSITEELFTPQSEFKESQNPITP